MSRILTKASAVSVAATVLMMIFGAAGSGAAAQKPAFGAAQSESANLPSTQGEAAVPVQPMDHEDSATLGDDAASTPAPVDATTLAKLVAQHVPAEALSQDLACMAGAIYFEARNETLEGQLAVARVIVARAKSGRFPDSYCGVVYQPSQFSFIHGSTMPVINHQSRTWKNAVAIAEIAHSGDWQSPVEGALFFHAKRIAPNWRLHRVARIDNHVFYR